MIGYYKLTNYDENQDILESVGIGFKWQMCEID